MADGLFDDLIPAQPRASTSGGLFDDLVPRPAIPNQFAGVTATVDTTAQPVVTLGDVTRVDPAEVVVPEGIAPEPGLLESLYRRAQAGLGSQIGGAIRFLGDALAPDVGPVSPNVRAVLDAALPQRVVGQQASTLGADVTDFSAALRETAQSGQRPEGVIDAITSPVDTLRYYGGIAAESLPATLGALATRNPSAATAAISGLTGAQVYGEQRRQGISQPQALQQATQQALIEAAGSRGALEEAFVPGSLLARLPRVAVPEVLGESGTEVLQTIADRPDTPLGELLTTALDAAIASAPGAVVETLGGATERAPSTSIAPTRPERLGGRPVPDDVAPAPVGINQETRQAPIMNRAEPAPAPTDPLADLDALLAALSPETLSQAADVLGGPPSPAASPSPADPPTADLPRGGEAAATLPTTRAADEYVPPVAPEGVAPQIDEEFGTDAPPTDGKRVWRDSGRKNKQGRAIFEPTIDYSRDGLLEYLAAAGGLNFEDIRREGGADPALLRDRTVANPLGGVGFPALRKTGGLSLDRLRESMIDDGWFPADDPNAPPTVSNADVVDRVMDAINGRPVPHPIEGQERRAMRDAGRREAEGAFEDFVATQQADAAAQADAVRSLREANIAIDDADAAEAASLVELAQRARDAGIDEIDVAPFANEPAADYARRLWTLTGDRSNAPDRRAAPPDRAAGLPDAEAGPVAETVSAGATGQPQARAQVGLFGAPSARETVDAAARQRDAQRNGQTGTGRTDMQAGAGELFAGPRPQQAEIPSQRPAPVPRETSSWVIRNKETGEVIAETFDRKKVDALNTAKYEAVPVQQHLAEVSQPGTLAYRVARGETEAAAPEKPTRRRNPEGDYVIGVGSVHPTKSSSGRWTFQVFLRDNEGKDYTHTVNAHTKSAAQDFQSEYAQRIGEAVDNAREDMGPLADVSRDLETQTLSADESQALGEQDADAKGFREAVNKIIGRSLGQDVVYLRGTAGLPSHLRQGIEARVQQRQGQGRTAALYDPNTRTTYLFTDVIASPERAAWNAAHEIAGHHGLRTLLGDKLDHALNIARQNPTVKAVADAIASERKLRGDQTLLATEEALAELAAAVRTGDFAGIESRYGVPVPEGVRDKLQTAIANFLKRLKAAIEDLFGRPVFTDEDVRALLEAAWQAADGGPTLADTRAPGDAVESTAPDQTQTPAFRRWFGDSKVVDANGEPLVVYKGMWPYDWTQETDTSSGPVIDSIKRTTPFPAFNNGEEGVDIGGFFGDADTASRFAEGMRGGAVYPVYLSIQNPYVVNAAGKKAGDVQFGEAGKAWRDAMRSGQYDGSIIKNTADEGTIYVTMRAEQVKSATANRGTFDPASPSILENVEPDARAEARATTRMTPAAAEAAAEVRRNDLSQTLPAGRGTIGWQYDDSAWIGTKGQASNARARLQDKMIAWRDVQQQIASQVSEAIPDTANVYRLENLMHGRVSTGIERIERVQVEPLVEAMRKAGVSTATLEEYLYARHAKERNADIAAKNPAMQDGGSGMTNAEADAILASADRAKLEPLARRVDALVRSTRQRLLDAGLITQQSFDAMEAQYSAYVPLRGKRAAETDFQPSEGGAGRGIDTRRNPVREALGRGAGNRADNLLGEVIGDAQRSVILAEKARVGRAVLRLVLTHPNPSLWQVEPVQTERTTDASGEVYERVVHDWSDPSIIAVKHRGQTYRVQINNVPLAQALSNVGVDQMGAVSRAAGAINRYFSAVLTKYNPAFLPVNATRDAIFGMTAMAAEHGERAALDAALHYPQAATAAFRHSIGKPGAGQWDTWAAEFADAGGRTGYVAMPSVEDLSRQIGKGALSGYSPEGVKRAAKAVADALGSMNDAVENALRLSAYVTLRKRGESVEAAASYAKDLTVNFNRKGYDGSRLNAWFLFYNAGIQGAKRVSDVLRKPKAWAYVGGLMAAQTIAAMYAMGLEDDDGEPLWNKVPDHVKRRNLVMVLPDGGVLTVPMPYGFNVFTYMAGRVPAAVMDRDDKRSHRAATVAADLLATATESFFPVPVGDGALGLLPTVLRIPVNIQTNRDDFGREIRRESLSKFDVPRASMGRPDTLEVFKLAAQGMNRVGGGDKYTPPALSWFDVAPEDMEYLLGQLGGGAGKFAIDVATVGQQLAGGELTPEIKPQDIPITGRFVSTIDQQASTAALFYERRDAINRSLERVRDLYNEQGEKAAEAALKASPELTGAAFKRRKKDSDSGPAGSVIESNGRPQIIVGKPDSVFGRYKDAEEVIEARNEGVRQAFTATPASLLPTRETRLRDASVRQQNVMRQAAQRELNAAWVRDVVGSAE